MLEKGNHVIFNYHRSNLRKEIPEQENEKLIQIPIDITTELIEDICEFDFGKCGENFHDQLSSSDNSQGSAEDSSRTDGL